MYCTIIIGMYCSIKISVSKIWTYVNVWKHLYSALIALILYFSSKYHKLGSLNRKNQHTQSCPEEFYKLNNQNIKLRINISHFFIWLKHHIIWLMPYVLYNMDHMIWSTSHWYISVSSKMRGRSMDHGLICCLSIFETPTTLTKGMFKVLKTRLNMSDDRSSRSNQSHTSHKRLFSWYFMLKDYLKFLLGRKFARFQLLGQSIINHWVDFAKRWFSNDSLQTDSSSTFNTWHQ